MGLLEIHLYNGRLVAAPHHWAGQRPLLLDICVNHIEGSLLVISVPAVPEMQEFRTVLFPSSSSSPVGHAHISDQCPAPRICIGHLVDNNNFIIATIAMKITQNIEALPHSLLQPGPHLLLGLSRPHSAGFNIEQLDKTALYLKLPLSITCIQFNLPLPV